MALVCVTPLTAFTPMSPNRHVVSNGEFFVVLDPDKKPDLATAFQVTDDGFKHLWQSKGWFGYDNEIFLAPDGMSLVRIERIPNDLNGKKITEQPVLFFYYKGILVKEYKLSELVSDMSSLEDIGRYGGFGSLWMDKAEIVQSDGHDINTDRKDEKPDEQTRRSYNHFTFRLKTLEKSVLFFDLLDGKRITRKQTEVVEEVEESKSTDNPFDDQNSEQGGADQPATAPKSKPTDNSTPNPESNPRPQ